jgi:lipid-binding SYLF domain-containing protein
MGVNMMSNKKNTRRQFIASAAALAAAASVPALAQAQGKPDATIEFSLWRAGFIIGGAGGSGTMVFKDNGYHLNIGGVSLGATIGVARTDFVGEVYNLKQAKDIEGTYTAVGAGGALAGGAGVAELQNSRGVRLRVSGRQIGLMVSIDLSGMQLSLRS